MRYYNNFIRRSIINLLEPKTLNLLVGIREIFHLLDTHVKQVKYLEAGTEIKL